MAAFQKDFLALVADYDRDNSPQESAREMRRLIKTGLLRFTDMRDRPELFFLAHRLLATRMLGGFGIRFTVTFNLFAGSVLGLGTEAQIAQLDDMQRAGELGCFALTEVDAGVMSGLIVETTATYDAGRDEFVIQTPHPGARKNWISGGLTADWCVLIADLEVGGRRRGPHPFLFRMRSAATGELVDGVAVSDMGVKTVANDLDNARITFDGLRVPRSALLSRFGSVRGGGDYVVGEERMRIEVIGQRLLTGRMVIAEAAMVGLRALLGRTREYCQQKRVNGLGGTKPALAELPQLRTLFSESLAQLDRLERFCAAVEGELIKCLRDSTIPDDRLVERIATAKVRCIEDSLVIQHRLEAEVGSYALMSVSGFQYKDLLLCCKFAEGDSRVLKMKMARDRLEAVKKRGVFTELARVPTLDANGRAESWAALRLARAMSAAMQGGGTEIARVWDAEWETVYGLADAVCARHMREVAAATGGGSAAKFPEPIVARL